MSGHSSDDDDHAPKGRSDTTFQRSSQNENDMVVDNDFDHQTYAQARRPEQAAGVTTVAKAMGWASGLRHRERERLPVRRHAPKRRHQQRSMLDENEDSTHPFRAGRWSLLTRVFSQPVRTIDGWCSKNLFFYITNFYTPERRKEM